MRLALLALALAALPQLAAGQTPLADYQGRVACEISRVCVFEKRCAGNTWRIKDFELDFRDDGTVWIAFGLDQFLPAVVMSPRPTADNRGWWNLAWMQGGPNLLQIGEDAAFSLIQGPVERMGPDSTPPIMFLGSCAP
jgi:hypothetical protein